jgi:phosphate acetyltransferase/phosphate butyryltransferase
VKSKDDSKKWVVLDCQVTNQEGKAVVTGEAQVIPPTEKSSREAVKLDDFTLRQTFSE